MGSRTAIAIAVGLALLSTTLGSAARAATTFSPPIRNSDGQNLLCVAENLSGSDVSVTAELEDGLGTVVDSGTVTVPAGETRTLLTDTSSVFGAFCRFTFTGDPAEVRGAISLQDAGGSNTRLLLPAPEPGARLLQLAALLGLGGLALLRRRAQP